MPSRPELLRYGPHPDQLAELHLPGGPGPFRAVVSIHGGFFRAAYDRSVNEPLARDLARSGSAVLNVEYRRTGTPGTPVVTTDDVMAAVSAADADERLRPGLTVVGHSAGGYLALWAASHPAVALVVALAPVADLEDCALGGHGGTAVPDWLGAWPEADPGAYARADLLQRLPTGTRTVVVHGAADESVPVRQGERYVAAARAAGDPTTMLRLEGQGHFGVIEPGHPAYEAWSGLLPADTRD